MTLYNGAFYNKQLHFFLPRNTSETATRTFHLDEATEANFLDDFYINYVVD